MKDEDIDDLDISAFGSPEKPTEDDYVETVETKDYSHSDIPEGPEEPKENLTGQESAPSETLGLTYDDEDPEYNYKNPSNEQNEQNEQKNDEAILFASEKEEKKSRKNDADFLNRQKVLFVIMGIILLVMGIVVFVIPMLKKDKESETVVDKRGSVYIPDMVKRFEPEKTVDNLQTFLEEPFRTSSDEENIQTDDEILAKIPFSDEAKKENIAPVTITTESTVEYVSNRPTTNTNEQQKSLQRMSMSSIGTGVSSLTSSLGNSTSSYNSDTYAQYSQDRMSDLTQSLSSLSSYGTQNNSSSNSSYDILNGQTNKQSFVNTNAGNIGMQIHGENALYKGTIINAALVTGINTDLPGVVIARVTKNVYSSLDGRYLLIPAGSHLYATYNSSVSYGQDRVQVAWDTLIRPDGLEVNLGNMVGVDSQGRSGYAGFVNEHPFEYLKAMGLIAAFSILDTKAMNIIDSQDNMYAQNAIADTYSTLNEVGSKMIDRALDIQPTITIAQGKEVNIITNVTFDLPAAQSPGINQKYVRQ